MLKAALVNFRFQTLVLLVLCWRCQEQKFLSLSFFCRNRHIFSEFCKWPVKRQFLRKVGSQKRSYTKLRYRGELSCHTALIWVRKYDWVLVCDVLTVLFIPAKKRKAWLIISSNFIFGPSFLLLNDSIACWLFVGYRAISIHFGLCITRLSILILFRITSA